MQVCKHTVFSSMGEGPFPVTCAWNCRVRLRPKKKKLKTSVGITRALVMMHPREERDENNYQTIFFPDAKTAARSKKLNGLSCSEAEAWSFIFLVWKLEPLFSIL